jgi:hypothetical protein
MATNKERIKMLEAGLGEVQDGIQRMELSMSNKMRQLEETINKLATQTEMASLIQLMRRMTKADKYYLLKWPSYNFHDILDKTRQGGLIVWISSLNSRILQPTKRCL